MHIWAQLSGVTEAKPPAPPSAPPSSTMPPSEACWASSKVTTRWPSMGQPPKMHPALDVARGTIQIQRRLARRRDVCSMPTSYMLGADRGSDTGVSHDRRLGQRRALVLDVRISLSVGAPTAALVSRDSLLLRHVRRWRGWSRPRQARRGE